MAKRKPWQEEMEIVDRTLKAISGIVDPEQLVDVYWNGIDELIPYADYVALSRRDVPAPEYIVTRSSRFTEHPDPWKERHRLPRLTGGILGELIYANRPVIINNLPARLARDDPGRFYLEGFDRLIALPQYDNGEGLNVSVMLLPPEIEPDPTMIPILHWQAGLFGRGTQNLVLRNQLAAALASLDRELLAVGEIQRSLLPRTLPSIPGFEVAAHYQTSARAGGDYYDFFPLEAGRWGVFIADVSGHGTPAAVLMAITHAIAHAQPGSHAPPKTLLRYLNDQLVSTYTTGGTFVTAFYAVLDPATHELTYAVAGHNPPRLARRGGVISLNESSLLPMGIEANQEYEQTTIKLERGDLLLLYTDGITEAMAPLKGTERRQLFGCGRLDTLLVEHEHSSAERCIATIRDAVGRFSGHHKPVDDQTLIALRSM